MNKLIYLFCTLAVITSCRNQPGSIDPGTISFEELYSPAGTGGEPNLFVSSNGQVYLSWIEYLDDTTNALMFSLLDDQKWGPATKIAQGSDWFVNWADFPSLVAFPGKSENLAAHWLQKSAGGTYDYDVRVAISNDHGKTWSPSFIPHTDGISAEHGFVTMIPLNNGNVFATWLDGRNTKTGTQGQEDAHGHGHGGGAMTLRAAEFDTNGNLYGEAELDDRICDCCQTDAAVTSNGPIVVYRDRSEEEVRDISIVRQVNGQWSEPKKVFDDHWEIAGCPVNGPAIAAQGQNVAIAWFTGAEGANRVKVSFSANAGETFSPPVVIDDGRPIGRVDIIFIDSETALVSWIENASEGGEIRLAKVNAREKTGPSITAAQTGISRQSGFPILEKTPYGLLLAWTNVDTETTIKTLSFSL